MLDLDDENPDPDIAVEEEDDDVSAVLGGLDLGQVDRGEASFGIGREREAQYLDEDLGGEGGAVFEEIHEDLVSHGGHGGEGYTRAGEVQFAGTDILGEEISSARAVAMLVFCRRGPGSRTYNIKGRAARRRAPK
jgi:hypothetical protein